MKCLNKQNEILLILVTYGITYMGVNSIRADNLPPLVLGIIIFNKTEVNIFGQLLHVYSSGLVLLIHGHFVTFVSVQDLFVKGKQV